MATKQRFVPLFNDCLVKMNAILAGVVYVGLIFNMNHHHRATNSHGCKAEEYERKFQRVVMSEIVTLGLFFSSVWVGAAAMITTNMKNAIAAEEPVVVDENAAPPATNQGPKYRKGEVVALGLTLVSYISLIIVAIFLTDYHIAGIYCSGD